MSAMLQALQTPGRSLPCSHCHRSLPQSVHRRQWGRPGVALRAVAAEDKTGIDADKIGALEFPPDNETWQDVMAFKGPAPERVNGRIAMMAFLLISLGELSSGRSVLQQLSVHPIWTTFFAITLSAASIMPKVVSGMPLEALQNAASRDDLPEKLRFFNKTHEIWVGRVAMLGLVGLTLTEAFITKGALFHRG